MENFANALVYKLNEPLLLCYQYGPPNFFSTLDQNQELRYSLFQQACSQWSLNTYDQLKYFSKPKSKMVKNRNHSMLLKPKPEKCLHYQ